MIRKPLLSAGSRPRHQDLYDGSSEAVLPQDCRDFQNVATKDFSKLPKEQKLAGVFPMHSIGGLERFQTISTTPANERPAESRRTRFPRFGPRVSVTRNSPI